MSAMRPKRQPKHATPREEKSDPRDTYWDKIIAEQERINGKTVTRLIAFVAELTEHMSTGDIFALENEIDHDRSAPGGSQVAERS